ncbi:uncharacterized protein CXQ87_004748 [Candidozyma duobushaemuli]|uniref:SUN domain-containing protein n=2 Tax=Candidozyma TaxID=3303203 RepID=A0ABX8IAU3_9ASCO|nr:uncharacterized protein CXQ87_004748 [[Candida] duobushaemulonis]PVH16457.1 hypothetical protein CXQ87_004748 [[Candida] duobushaemulonis]QWU90224.1 hypothetical protein CA3LBN_004585 [[Candida] haemuloni]
MRWIWLLWIVAAYADTEAPPQGTSESLDQSASVEEPSGLNESLAIDIEDSAHGNYSDDCHFLSFEEWKKQKELEAQEEPPKVSSTQSMGNALETIKEDIVSSSLLDVDVEDQGKTYKDKFNYASGDCAATVMKTNSDAKGASAILSEVKDSYLLNKCATPNKFVVIELCQDILVSSIVMANFELFSSMFKRVRFSVSDQFPSSSWQVLGEIEAQNIRDTQVFDIENPLIWARYLKIDILSHYGDEFYCPISVVRVHGTTMMEEVKKDSPKSEPVSEPAASSVNVLFEYTDDDEGCKALSPYLALNEFLKDINNGTGEYCNIPANTSSIAESTSTAKTTQESIFKNIVKRLSLLESNASLSLLYVEEQSKLLSDAFTNLEKRHALKLNNLLSKFNHTVNAQVQHLQSSFELTHQQSNSLLERQEQALRNVLGDLVRRNKALVSDLGFQRKIIIVDTLLILVLLVYVIIIREFDLGDEAPRRPKRRPKRKFTVASKKALTR